MLNSSTKVPIDQMERPLEYSPCLGSLEFENIAWVDIVATRAISRGEEILADYDYLMHDEEDDDDAGNDSCRSAPRGAIKNSSTNSLAVDRPHSESCPRESVTVSSPSTALGTTMGHTATSRPAPQPPEASPEHFEVGSIRVGEDGCTSWTVRGSHVGFKDGRTSKQRKQGKFQKRWVLAPDKPARRVVERDHGGRERGYSAVHQHRRRDAVFRLERSRDAVEVANLAAPHPGGSKMAGRRRQ